MVAIFFAGVIALFLGSVHLTAAVYRRHNPDGQPRGWVKFSEDRITQGWYGSRRLPPYPLGVAVGIIGISAGVVMIVASLS